MKIIPEGSIILTAQKYLFQPKCFQKTTAAVNTQGVGERVFKAISELEVVPEKNLSDKCKRVGKYLAATVFIITASPVSTITNLFRLIYSGANLLYQKTISVDPQFQQELITETKKIFRDFLLDASFLLSIGAVYLNSALLLASFSITFAASLFQFQDEVVDHFFDSAGLNNLNTEERTFLLQFYKNDVGTINKSDNNLLKQFREKIAFFKKQGYQFSSLVGDQSTILEINPPQLRELIEAFDLIPFDKVSDETKKTMLRWKLMAIATLVDVLPSKDWQSPRLRMNASTPALYELFA